MRAKASRETIDGKSSWIENHRLILSVLSISVLINLIAVFYFLSGYLEKKGFLNDFFTESKVDIVVLGDSRAQGGNWANGLARGSGVKNLGVGHMTSSQIFGKLSTAISLNPKTCIIQIGVNDIRMGHDSDSTVRNFSKIIDSLSAHSIKPIITSIIPLRKDYWFEFLDENEVNRRVKSLNERIALLCMDKSSLFVDVNKQITEQGRLKREYTWDGIHLNDSGYYWVFREIRPLLNE